ncbi:MAG: inorganic phosphate transporter [Pyrinomonadaceae bacterium]
MTISFLLFAAVCFLAYSNGSNDNFKGVASIYGSRTAGYKTALGWATVTTLLGSVASFFVANGLLQTFSGKGIVPNDLAGAEQFLLAVAVGAGATVILATLTGFPISTTHGLTGAIVGAGLMAVGGAVNFAALQTSFVLPLLVSPFLAVVIAAAIYAIAHFMRKRTRISKETCICVGNEFVPVTIGGNAMAFQSNEAHFSAAIDETANCVERYDGNFFGISFQKLIDAGHFLSAGVVSFARGLNDTPKIAALLLAAQAVNLKFGWAMVAAAMAIGGLVNARKVAETMSNDITKMNSGQAFSANLATGFLVIFASSLGVPVSTTHVSVGSLFGIGLVTKQADLRVVSSIVLSWIITLPCAAVIAGLTFWLANQF